MSRSSAAASAIPVIAGYALRESIRRRVFVVVLLLTLGFLALYGLGAREAFQAQENFRDVATGVDGKVIAGATVFGLSMFATLFLGTVLAVFLTLGVVRGDAERGLLQPLVVRPVGRTTLLAARFAGAGAVCAGYTLAVYFAAMGLTWWAGSWSPDRIVLPGVELAAGVVVLTALSLLGSVFLSSTANGIAVFMVFGAGLVAGLLGQVGKGVGSERLESISEGAAWALPFEALYQDSLAQITAETRGLTGFILELGPFGGADAGGAWLGAWTVAYLLIVGVLASLGFARRDL
jgi:ABC-type transport system involved in multi-copper enzyme maturation permease subunit